MSKTTRGATKSAELNDCLTSAKRAQVAFLALDAKGQPGAACTVGTGFQYAVARPGKIELLRAKEIPVETKPAI